MLFPSLACRGGLFIKQPARPGRQRAVTAEWRGQGGRWPRLCRRSPRAGSSLVPCPQAGLPWPGCCGSMKGSLWAGVEQGHWRHGGPGARARQPRPHGALGTGWFVTLPAARSCRRMSMNALLQLPNESSLCTAPVPCRPHHPATSSRLFEFSRPGAVAQPQPLHVKPQLCSARPSPLQCSCRQLRDCPHALCSPLLGTGLSGIQPGWGGNRGRTPALGAPAACSTHKSEEGRMPAWGSWPHGFRHLQPREARLGCTSQGVAGCQRQCPPASSTLLS